MHNLIEQAVQCGDRDAAASLIATALNIEDQELCLLWLPEQANWQKLQPCQRAGKIGDWLYSEALKLMDLDASTPMAVVGTND